MKEGKGIAVSTLSLGSFAFITVNVAWILIRNATISKSQI